MTTTNQNNKNEITITRIFDAPRELVFKAWTDPDLVRQWWGPKGFTSPVARIDLRVGGEYFNCMRSPEGKDYWSKGVFREIVAPARLVMTDSFAHRGYQRHGTAGYAAGLEPILRQTRRLPGECLNRF